MGSTDSASPAVTSAAAGETPALSHRLERSEQCRGDHHYDDEPQPGINLRAALGVRVIKEPDLKQQGSGDGELNREIDWKY